VYSSEDDVSVSDLGSDLEPEELLSTYLSTKTLLYKLRPDLVSDSTSKTRGNRQFKHNKKLLGEDRPLSPSIVKLQRKLKQVESDVLFDPREADTQWTLRRNQLAQDAASRRKYALIDESSTHRPRSPRKSVDLPADGGSQDPEKPVEKALLNLNTDEEEQNDDLLIPMFFTMSDENGVAVTDNSLSGNSSSTNVTIRDFGKSVGVSPRRVLEEACRSRYV
jgi:ATP-dependent RNA helicase DHX29